MNKYLVPIGIGLATFVGLVLVSGNASAGTTAKTGQKARVKSSTNTRTAPTTTAPLVAKNDAFVGSTVTVLATGIASTEPSKSREWWRIITPGGSTGYASAVGPAGEKNLELVP